MNNDIAMDDNAAAAATITESTTHNAISCIPYPKDAFDLAISSTDKRLVAFTTVARFRSQVNPNDEDSR